MNEFVFQKFGFNETIEEFEAQDVLNSKDNNWGYQEITEDGPEIIYGNCQDEEPEIIYGNIEENKTEIIYGNLEGNETKIIYGNL